jgi:hypothetical protein
VIGSTMRQVSYGSGADAEHRMNDLPKHPVRARRVGRGREASDLDVGADAPSAGGFPDQRGRCGVLYGHPDGLVQRELIIVGAALTMTSHDLADLGMNVICVDRATLDRPAQPTRRFR